MHIVSIVGARPQFVKLAAVCQTLARPAYRSTVQHTIVHTGQHYDRGMSDVFFSELGMPDPHFHLGVGSGSHAEQTGEMLKRLEAVLVEQRPDWVLLYGDTNSTLAGALVCSKIGIPTAHIEAGLRSFNRQMPEEVNRVVADHLGNILFCPTAEAQKNLENEGLGGRAVLTGDIMFDAVLMYRDVAGSAQSELAAQWQPKSFALATIHRAENTDNPDRLRAIAAALDTIAATICPVVLPLHPRTRKCLDAASITLNAVTVVPPVSYLEMLLLETRAQFIVTDSGGVQKEAYFVRVPCITARDETEWVETLTNGCNRLTGAEEAAIVSAAKTAHQVGPWSNPYGNGDSCEIMLSALGVKAELSQAISA